MNAILSSLFVVFLFLEPAKAEDKQFATCNGIVNEKEIVLKFYRDFEDNSGFVASQTIQDGEDRLTISKVKLKIETIGEEEVAVRLYLYEDIGESLPLSGSVRIDLKENSKISPSIADEIGVIYYEFSCK